MELTLVQKKIVAVGTFAEAAKITVQIAQISPADIDAYSKGGNSSKVISLVMQIAALDEPHRAFCLDRIAEHVNSGTVPKKTADAFLMMLRVELPIVQQVCHGISENISTTAVKKESGYENRVAHKIITYSKKEVVKSGFFKAMISQINSIDLRYRAALVDHAITQLKKSCPSTAMSYSSRIVAGDDRFAVIKSYLVDLCVTESPDFLKKAVDFSAIFAKDVRVQRPRSNGLRDALDTRTLQSLFTTSKADLDPMERLTAARIVISHAAKQVAPPTPPKNFKLPTNPAEKVQVFDGLLAKMDPRFVKILQNCAPVVELTEVWGSKVSVPLSTEAEQFQTEFRAHLEAKYKSELPAPKQDPASAMMKTMLQRFDKGQKTELLHRLMSVIEQDAIGIHERVAAAAAELKGSGDADALFNIYRNGPAEMVAVKELVASLVSTESEQLLSNPNHELIQVCIKILIKDLNLLGSIKKDLLATDGKVLSEDEMRPILESLPPDDKALLGRIIAHLKLIFRTPESLRNATTTIGPPLMSPDEFEPDTVEEKTAYALQVKATGENLLGSSFWDQYTVSSEA